MIESLATSWAYAILNIPFISGLNLFTYLRSDEQTWYGLGWEVSRDAANRPFYGHTGNSIGAFSKFLVYPEARMVFVILVNCGNPGIETETEQLIDFFLSEVKKEMRS